MADDLPIQNKPQPNDDFIPVPSVATSTSSTNEGGKISLAEKIKMARLAMQGPERTVERERNEREKQITKEKNELEQLLALTTKRKEDLEIAWVVLDNKRNDLKKMLTPILEEEEKLETQEEELEGRERTTSVTTDRQKIEKERLAVQAQRQIIEKEKWGFEDKILKIETSIKENTDKYQIHLDEEEEILNKIESLDGELALIAEQELLEAEEKKRKAELLIAESEKKRRAELEKVELAEQEKKRQEDLAQKMAEAKQKEAENKAKQAEEEKRKIENQKASIAASLEVERAKAAVAAQKAIDEAKKRAEEMALMKARGDMEIKRQAAENPSLSSSLKTPLTLDPNNLEKVLLEKNTSQPLATTEELESLDLPKLRTLKTDLAKIKGEGK